MIFWTHLEFSQTVVNLHVTVLDGSRQIGLFDEKLECAFRAPLVQTMDHATKGAGSMSLEPTDWLGVWRKDL